MIMYILKKLEWVAHTLLKNYEGHFEEVSKSPPVHESPQLRSIGWRIQIWQSRGKSSSSKNFDLTWPDLLGLKLFSSFQFVMILANKDCRIKRALHSSESQCVGVILLYLLNQQNYKPTRVSECWCNTRWEGTQSVLHIRYRESLLQQIKYPILFCSTFIYNNITKFCSEFWILTRFMQLLIRWRQSLPLMIC